MSIQVNGEVAERRDTTANWNYVNPILPDGQLGWEYNNITDKLPVGVKMGDGTSHWDTLTYWFSTNTRSKYVIDFPSGTGFTIDWQTDTVDGFTYASLFGNDLFRFPSVWFQTTPGVYAPSDSKPSVNYTDSSETLIDTIIFDWGVTQVGKIVF